VDCVFIGYTRPGSVLWFLVHDSKNHGICKNTILEAKNESWFEHVFPCLGREQPGSSRLVDEVVQKDEIFPYNEDVRDESQEQPETEEAEIRSNGQRTEKSFGPDFLTYTVESEPQTYRPAVTSSVSCT
jgi:hypothetical protein